MAEIWLTNSSQIYSGLIVRQRRMADRASGAVERRDVTGRGHAVYSRIHTNHSVILYKPAAETQFDAVSYSSSPSSSSSSGTVSSSNSLASLLRRLAVRGDELGRRESRRRTVL